MCVWQLCSKLPVYYAMPANVDLMIYYAPSVLNYVMVIDLCPLTQSMCLTTKLPYSGKFRTRKLEVNCRWREPAEKLTMLW